VLHTVLEFAVDEESQALLEGKCHHVRHLELLNEGPIHAREAQGLEFVEGGMREHDGSPLASF